MKNILIIAALITAQILAFYSISNGQESHSYGGNGTIVTPKERADTSLIADETTLNYTKTEAKIDCDNERVFNEIFKTHGTLFKRFTCTWKTDRYGRYKHYVIYLSKEDSEIIRSWAKTNL